MGAVFAHSSFWGERQQTERATEEKRQKTIAVIRGLKSHDSNSPELPSADPFGLNIPLQHASIVESWNPPNADPNFPLVIHIQDVHGHPTAQKNAAGVMRALLAAQKAPLRVYVEGAWTRVNPDWLAVFPDEAAKRQAAESLLEQSEITGEEYLAILSGPGQLEIWGIEDEEVYNANLKARLLLDPYRDLLLERVDALEKALQKIKARVWPKSLVDLDWQARQYEDGTVGLREYVNFIYARHKSFLNRESYPHLTLLIDLYNAESRNNREKVQAEVARILKLLSGKIDKNTFAQLSQLSLKFRSGQMEGTNYFETLIRLSEMYGSDSSILKDYVAYLKFSENLKGEFIPREIQKLEIVIYESYGRQSAAAKKLVDMALALRLQKKFWDERFSPDDWKEYERRSSKNYSQSSAIGLDEIEKYCVANGEKVILSITPQKRFQRPGESPSGAAMQESPKEKLSFSQMQFLQEAYYRLAFKRNGVLAQHFLSDMKKIARDSKSKKDPVVLIAGGFHTPGLMALMRNASMRYIVVRPKVIE